MEMFDYKQAVKIMEGYGYNFTAENHAKNVLFFLKNFDNKNLHIHATVTLATHLIDLDTTGNLDLGVTLYCDSVDLENVKFLEFEKKLYNYLYLCVYGKPFCSMEDDTENGLYFKTESKINGGGEPIGGDVTAKGKAEKKPSISVDDRKSSLWEKVRQVGKEKNYDKDACKAFYYYWTEMNEGGKKMRFEMESVFDVSRRLVTWMKNEKQWKPAWKQKQESEAKENNKRKPVLNHKELF